MKLLTTIAFIVAAQVLASGCASHDSQATGSDGHARGMMCPKCETVWTSNVEGQGTKMQRLTTAKGMTCPDCDAMAKAYLEGDDLVLHDCPTCKVKPMPMTSSSGAPSTHSKGTH